MLTDQEMEAVRKLLELVSLADILSMANTISQAYIEVNGRSAAVEAILRCTERPVDLLMLKKMTKRILFNFLFDNKVNISKKINKRGLILAVLKLWETDILENMKSSRGAYQERPTMQSRSGTGTSPRRQDKLSSDIEQVRPSSIEVKLPMALDESRKRRDDIKLQLPLDESRKHQDDKLKEDAKRKVLRNKKEQNAQQLKEDSKRKVKRNEKGQNSQQSSQGADQERPTMQSSSGTGTSPRRGLNLSSSDIEQMQPSSIGMENLQVQLARIQEEDERREQERVAVDEANLKSLDRYLPPTE